jgi:hypothetical protein
VPGRHYKEFNGSASHRLRFFGEAGVDEELQ